MAVTCMISHLRSIVQISKQIGRFRGEDYMVYPQQNGNTSTSLSVIVFYLTSPMVKTFSQ